MNNPPVIRGPERAWFWKEPDSVIPSQLEPLGAERPQSLIYICRPRQLPAQGNVRGFCYAFYPARVEGNEVVLLQQTPSWPPGYGLDHDPGTRLPLGGFDARDFYHLRP